MDIIPNITEIIIISYKLPCKNIKKPTIERKNLYSNPGKPGLK